MCLTNVEISISFFGVKISYSIYVCSTSTHNSNFLTSFLFKLLSLLNSTTRLYKLPHVYSCWFLTDIQNLVESKLCQDDDLGILLLYEPFYFTPFCFIFAHQREMATKNFIVSFKRDSKTI